MSRAELDPELLVCQARAGDVRARARLFSLVENGGLAAQNALAELAPLANHACVVGITGPPGAGKSTLLGRMAAELRRHGQTVAIFAIDPSSPLTGGAILGDRIRMQDLHGDPGVFVRSISTRGAVGGLARAVGDLVVTADALGYDVILVETVGAGQDETAIARVAPTVVLVEVPHLGDDVQAIKAGILEVTDIFVVNKADRGDADQAVAILRAMLSLGQRHDDWVPPIVKTSATTGDGVPRLLDAIRDHRAYLQREGRLEAWHRERARADLLAAVRDRLFAQAMARISSEQLDALVDEVASRRLDLASAVDRLIGEPGC